MSPRTKVRAAQVLIPIALAIAALGGIVGNWYVVAAMALLIVSQAIN